MTGPQPPLRVLPGGEEDQVPRLNRFREAHPDVVILLKGHQPTAFIGTAKVTGLTLAILLDKLDELAGPAAEAVTCQACGITDPPPQMTCHQGRDHRVGTSAGCSSCGRLPAACAQRPCTARRGSQGARPG